MANKYKVWVVVERINEQKNEYEDIDLPFGGVAEFKTEGKAVEFASRLNDEGLLMAGRDEPKRKRR